MVSGTRVSKRQVRVFVHAHVQVHARTHTLARTRVRWSYKEEPSAVACFCKKAMASASVPPIPDMT